MKSNNESLWLALPKAGLKLGAYTLSSVSRAAKNVLGPGLAFMVLIAKANANQQRLGDREEGLLLTHNQCGVVQIDHSSFNSAKFIDAQLKIASSQVELSASTAFNQVQGLIDNSDPSVSGAQYIQSVEIALTDALDAALTFNQKSGLENSVSVEIFSENFEAIVSEATQLANDLYIKYNPNSEIPKVVDGISFEYTEAQSTIVETEVMQLLNSHASNLSENILNQAQAGLSLLSVYEQCNVKNTFMNIVSGESSGLNHQMTQSSEPDSLHQLNNLVEQLTEDHFSPVTYKEFGIKNLGILGDMLSRDLILGWQKPYDALRFSLKNGLFSVFHTLLEKATNEHGVVSLFEGKASVVRLKDFSDQISEYFLDDLDENYEAFMEDKDLVPSETSRTAFESLQNFIQDTLPKRWCAYQEKLNMQNNKMLSFSFFTRKGGKGDEYIFEGCVQAKKEPALNELIAQKFGV